MKASLEWNFREVAFKKKKFVADSQLFAAEFTHNRILVGQQ